MGKKGKETFIRAYFYTILEIIETESTFSIPLFVYCIMSVILFMQIAGYIYSTYEIKPILERQAA